MTNEQNKHLFIPLSLECFPYMDMIFLIKKHGKIVNASLEFSAGYTPPVVTLSINFDGYGVIAKYYAARKGIQMYEMKMIPAEENILEHNIDSVITYISVCLEGLEQCRIVPM